MNFLLPMIDETVNLDHLDNLDKLSNIANAAHSAPALIGALTGLFAVILVLGMPVFIVIAVLTARSRRQRRLNDLILKLAEKGQPVPPELFITPGFVPSSRRQSPDQRRGIFWCAVGIGLFLFGAFEGDSSLMGIGCIPLMIGLGFLVADRLENKPLDK
jgi:hypothetical protein